MKKKKRSLTKEQRDALLRSLSTSHGENTVINTNAPTSSGHQVSQRDSKDAPSLTTTKELKRIGTVFCIIFILLVGAILIDRNTSYLGDVGRFIAQRFGL